LVEGVFGSRKSHFHRFFLSFFHHFIIHQNISENRPFTRFQIDSQLSFFFIELSGAEEYWCGKQYIFFIESFKSLAPPLFQ